MFKVKRKKRILFGVLAVIILAIVIWWTNLIPILVQRYYEYKVLSGIENLKEAYRNDTLGGDTPEETLKMFVNAFKSGDLKLASKYFIPEKQAEYLAKMENWVKVGKKEEIIKSLENSRMLGKLRDDSFVAVMGEVDENGEVLHNIDLMKNSLTRKWNINSM